jgi:hypothetical protein
MLQAYLDESGIHADAEVCIVAGYFGKKGPWRRLESGWKAVLRNRDFDVPLDKFRAKDAVKGTDYFYGWGDDRRETFLGALGKAIADSGVHPVCYGLIVSEFFNFSLAERRFLTGATWNAEQRRFLSSGSPNRPYFVAFTECLKIVSLRASVVSKADFYFGTDRAVAKYAESLFRYLKWRSRIITTDKFGRIAFPYASETPALQAADLFSYLSYRHMIERRQTGDWKTPPSRLLLSMLQNRKDPGDTSFRTEQHMRAMMAHVPLLAQGTAGGM